MFIFLLVMLVLSFLSLGVLFYFKREEVWIDALIQLALVLIITGGGYMISYWSGTADREIWNGEVISKTRDEVSCRHSYECNCYYTTDSKGNSTRHCSTCYEHSFDVDWNVHSSTAEESGIDTVDRQGLVMPPRWGAAYVGEPYASGHHFENYIKANPSSVLFGTKGHPEQFQGLIPAYPSVYDYYKVQHVYNMQVPNVDSDVWNALVAKANRPLGPSKQVNLIVVLVKTADPNYAYAFRDVWLGGKKNDAIILIGSTNGHDILWADVVSWSTDKAYEVNVKDRIMDEKYLDHTDTIVSIIAGETGKNFHRMHMKDMKWLMRSFQPSSGEMMWMFVLALLGIVGESAVSYYNFQENGGRYGY